MSSMGATKFSKVDGNKAFFWDAPNRGSVTPDDVQYPISEGTDSYMSPLD